MKYFRREDSLFAMLCIPLAALPFQLEPERAEAFFAHYIRSLYGGRELRKRATFSSKNPVKKAAGEPYVSQEVREVMVLKDIPAPGEK